VEGDAMRRDDIWSGWVDPSRTRDKFFHPYSYDEFFRFGSRETIRQPGLNANYSDRLWQWDREKADRLWRQYVDTRWESASAAQLSAFLSAYHGQPVEVVALAEGCNQSNGYPYFIVWWKPAGSER
jgi:hypothetical protein